MNVTVAEDPSNAIVGLEVNSSVQKNSRDPLVYVTNNLADDATVTVELDTCDEGTLYDPAGNADDCADAGDDTTAVTSTIGSGETGRFDIDADVSGQYIYFSIAVSAPGFSLEVAERTYAEAGNVKGAVVVKKFQGLDTNTGGTSNEWTIDNVKIFDDDGDDDLDRVDFEIQEGTATVATLTVTCGCNGGAKYSPNGNPAVTIEPDDPDYTVDDATTYSATVVGYDADGNYDSDTVTTDE